MSDNPTGIGPTTDVGDQEYTKRVVHAAPPTDSGVMPCCGKTVFETSRDERLTVHPERVTCRKREFTLRAQDVRIDIFRGSGLSVRLTHTPTGAVAVASDEANEQSELQLRAEAWRVLTNTVRELTWPDAITKTEVVEAAEPLNLPDVGAVKTKADLVEVLFRAFSDQHGGMAVATTSTVLARVAADVVWELVDRVLTITERTQQTMDENLLPLINETTTEVRELRALVAQVLPFTRLRWRAPQRAQTAYYELIERVLGGGK